MPEHLDLERTADSLIALIDGIGVQVLLTGTRIAAQRQYALVDHWIDTILRAEGPARSKNR